jgi:hypothetical protein
MVMNVPDAVPMFRGATYVVTGLGVAAAAIDAPCR